MPMFIRTAAAVSSAGHASPGDDRHADSRYAVSGFDATLALLRPDAPRIRAHERTDRARANRRGMRAVLGVCLVAAAVAAVQVHAAFRTVEAVRIADGRCSDPLLAGKRVAGADGGGPCPVQAVGGHRSRSGM